uniref:Alpha-1,3-mannosyl-glycoprotein 2-beta-N-acetylglucosaminyltransferase n=1 Tax=Panagrellus redivivus TaxID=6233 RepID=A0A7E4UPP0_PANRE
MVKGVIKAYDGPASLIPQKAASKPPGSSSLPYKFTFGSMFQLPCLPTRYRRQINCTRHSRKILLAAVLILSAFYVLLTQKGEGFAKLGQIDRKLLGQNAAPPIVGVEPVHVVVPKIVHPKALPKETATSIAQAPTAVLVMAATRAAAIRNHLEQILKHRPDPEQFPVIVSQDGDNEFVARAINEFVSDEKQVYSIRHRERTGIGSPSHKSAKNYFFIAQHYKFALDEVFFKRGYKTVIITEDDLDIAEDFFSYFRSTRHLLFEDPSIWCISAWNDNGNPSLVDRGHSEQLWRTDFFPGLGWMLSAETWKELSPIWPEAYWDDWLRQAKIRKNRVCIRPEVSRTSHNMKLAGKGSSNGLYKNFLASIRLPDKPVDFSLVDTDRLRKDSYDANLDHTLRSSMIISLDDLVNRTKATVANKEVSYRVVYQNPREFKGLAKAFGLMFDIRGGMSRTAYLGMVTFMAEGARVYAIHGDMDLEKPFGTQSASDIYSDVWDKKMRYLEFAEFYCKSRWHGKCDPTDPEMYAWFKKRNQLNRLKAWGELIVN